MLTDLVSPSPVSLGLLSIMKPFVQQTRPRQPVARCSPCATLVAIKPFILNSDRLPVASTASHLMPFGCRYHGSPSTTHDPDAQQQIEPLPWPHKTRRLPFRCLLLTQICDLRAPTLPFYNYDQIIRLINSHESFEVRPGCDLGGLPKYYDLVPYYASPDQEKELWKAEISRLVNVVNSNVPHHLQGEDAWFGAADADGYALLDRLTLQIRHAWLVSNLDNELIVLEHAPDLSDKDIIIRIERSLRREYDADNQTLRYKRPLKLDHFNDECYHALINHITANMAQILARTAQGRFWDEYFIATLAKLAAKMKWLADDLPRAVSTVISTKDEIVNKLSTEGRLPPAKARQDQEKEDNHEENVAGSGNRYFVVHTVFHQLFRHLFEALMDQLGSDEVTGIAPNVFETSVVLYDTGYWGDRAVIYGLRDGGIGGHGNKNAIYAAQAAIEVCGALFDEVKNESPPPIAPPRSEEASEHGEHGAPSSTTFYWHWIELDAADTETSGRSRSEPLLRSRQPYRGWRPLYRMKSVIDVLVPTKCSPHIFPARWGTSSSASQPGPLPETK